ncbi:MAG: hypothetical protein IJS00_04365 [Paludibacteraceae bacterium]|nr:hypothetical protein [Paludibacteraceae bacterium]
MSVGKMTSAQLSAYQNAAAKYRKELLALPVIGLEEILPYATLRMGVRYKEVVGNPSLGAQFAPYKVDMKSANDLSVDFRELETFLGAVNLEFEPNSVASMIMGELAATKGEAMKDAQIAREVLVQMAKDLAKTLNASIFSASRNANGTTTATLFNGFDTITTSEITGGGLAVARKNFKQLDAAITAANAVAKLKELYRAASPELRAAESVMLVSQDIMDAYNDNYETLHAATPYNLQFEQTFLEGSNNRCKLVALSSKSDSQYIHLTTKENMLIGVDQLGDTENIEVARFSPFTLNFIATMFFGVQFETLDARRLMVGKLAAAANGQS